MSKRKVKPINIVIPVVGGLAITGGVVAGAVIGANSIKAAGGVAADDTTVECTPDSSIGTLSFTLAEEVKDDQVFAYIKNTSSKNTLKATNDAAGVIFADNEETESTLSVNKKKVKANITLNNAPTIKGKYTYNFDVVVVYNKKSDGTEVRKTLYNLQYIYEVADDFVDVDESAVQLTQDVKFTNDEMKFDVRFDGYKYTGGSISPDNFFIDISDLKWDETLIGGVNAKLELDTENKTFNVVLTINDPTATTIKGNFNFIFNGNVFKSSEITVNLIEEDKISIGTDKEANLYLSEKGEGKSFIQYIDLPFTGLPEVVADPSTLTVKFDANWMRDFIKKYGFKIPSNILSYEVDTKDPRNKKIKIGFELIYTSSTVSKIISDVTEYPKFVFTTTSGFSQTLGGTKDDFILNIHPTAAIFINDYPKRPYSIDSTRSFEFRQQLVGIDENQGWQLNITADVFNKRFPDCFTFGISQESVGYAIVKITLNSSVKVDSIFDAGNGTFKITATNKAKQLTVEATSPSFNLRFETSANPMKTIVSSERIKVDSTAVASVVDAKGDNFSVTWASDDKKVATIDDNGVIHGVSAGKCKLTPTWIADISKKLTPVEVIVNKPITGITVTLWNGTESLGTDVYLPDETTGITAKATVNEGADERVTWSSSNTSVADVSVDKDGNANIEIYSFGPTEIIATSVDNPEIKGTANLYVTPLGMKFAKSSLVIDEDAKEKVDVVDKNNIVIPTEYLTFSTASETEEYISVARDGTITAKKAGSDTVNVVCGNKLWGVTASLPVTVNLIPREMNVSLDKTAIQVGETAVATATVTPALTEGTWPIIWTSEKPNIATIDNNGLIHAIAPGTVKFTAKVDGYESVTKTTAELTITAVPVPTKVEVSLGSSSILTGKTTIATANVTAPEDVDKTVTWKSSKPNVATIDSNGTIVALSAGTTDITATTVVGGLTSAAVTLTVTADLTTVSFDMPSKIEPDESITLSKDKFTVTYAGASDPVAITSIDQVVLTSDNTALIEPVKSGDNWVLTPKSDTAEGVATITCTTNITGLTQVSTQKVLQVLIDAPEITITDKTSDTITWSEATRSGTKWVGKTLFDGITVEGLTPTTASKLLVVPLFSTTTESGISNIVAAPKFDGNTYKGIEVSFDCINPLVTAPEWVGTLLFYWKDKLIGGDTGFTMNVGTTYGITFTGEREPTGTYSQGADVRFGLNGGEWQFAGFETTDLTNGNITAKVIIKDGATASVASATIDTTSYGMTVLLVHLDEVHSAQYKYITFDVEFDWNNGAQSIPMIALQGFTINLN